MENINLNQRERSNFGSHLKSYGYSQTKPKTQIIEIPLRVQARLDAAQTALILGFCEHDIPVLVRYGLLEPLGNDVAQNSRKYFAAVDIMAFADDPKWLSKATQAVTQNWNVKNANRKKSLVAA